MPLILKIPTQGARATQTFNITLSGQAVLITMNFSFFADSWFFTAAYTNGDVITSSRRIKSGVPILGGVYANGFIGNFAANPTRIPESRLSVDSFGTTHELIYYDASV